MFGVSSLYLQSFSLPLTRSQECNRSTDIYAVLVFSERENEFTFAMSSSVCLSSVCRLSVTFVRPTQATEIFGNVLCHLVRWPSVDFQVKFYGDRPRETPPSGELNTI